jgi:hypothetical protein
MSGSVPLAISALLSGTSSDEGSEALPGNRVYSTWVGARNSNFSSAYRLVVRFGTGFCLTKPDRSDILFGFN